MAVRNVEYIIGLRDRFTKGIDKINAKAFQLDGRMKRLDKSTSGFGKTLGRVFAGVVILGGIKKTIDAFEKQEFAIAQVRQGIASTGGVAGKTLKQLTEGAKKLQGETIFGDETILQGVTAQLLTFTNVTEENFERTQQAVLDVTTRLFGARASAESLRSTSIQLGKALNDPIRNMGALSRSGITFSQSQIDVIKELAETNRLAEAQAVILTELEKQYGGSAKAARDTAFGGIKVLQAQFQDLMVIIGEQFIPIILSTKGVLQGLIGFFTKNTKAIRILVKLTIAIIAAFVAYKTVTFLLTAALKIYVVGTKLAIVATRLFTKGTKAATSSAKIFGLVVKTTPIGLIASLLSVAAGAFLLFRDRTDEATEAQEKFNDQIERLKGLQEAIKSTKELFEVRKTLSQQGLIDLKVRLKGELNELRVIKETQFASLTAAKKVEDLKDKFQFDLPAAIGETAVFTKTIGEEEVKSAKAVEDRTKNLLKNREILQDQLNIIKKLIKPIPGLALGGISVQQVGITKIVSAAPKVFNINIEKLVETINNNVTTLKEGMNESKKVIVEALLGALNDTQALVR